MYRDTSERTSVDSRINSEPANSQWHQNNLKQGSWIITVISPLSRVTPAQWNYDA